MMEEKRYNKRTTSEFVEEDAKKREAAKKKLSRMKQTAIT